MKQTITLLLTICMVLFLLTGCNSNDKKAGNTAETAINTEQTTDNTVSNNTSNTQSVETNKQETNKSDVGIVYTTPSAAEKIELTTSDPSNNQIRFSYDKNNRITGCQYEVDGHTIILSYSYSGNTVQIYAFSDEYVAADETFTVSRYDPNAGFTSINGYYFRGCVF